MGIFCTARDLASCPDVGGGGGGGGRGDGGGIGVVGVVNCSHRNQKPKSKPNLETTSISVD